MLAGLFLLRSVFGEEQLISPVTVSTAETTMDKADMREEKVKQYAKNLISNILKGDAGTGEFPDAGFSVNVDNLELEKLLAGKEKLNKYILSLLREVKSGYTKERILRELFKKRGASEEDESTLETLYSLLKDRSSQVRYLAVKLLGERGSPSSVLKINSLLYDPFSLRKDVYPVRVAAREAIELIKIREEVKTLSGEECIIKWLQVLKEKAVLKQDYFCERAVKELFLLPSAKEKVWTELMLAKEQAGKKTLIENKIFSYLLLAASGLKDERSLPLIFESLKEASLQNMAVRASAALSLDQTIDILLEQSVGSERAELLFSAIKEKLAEKEVIDLPEPVSANDKEVLFSVAEKARQLLLIKRDPEVYIDAAELFAVGLNDYDGALSYIALYKSEGKEPAEHERSSEIYSKTLANKGKFVQVDELFPLLNKMPYFINLALQDLFRKKQIADTVKNCRKTYYLANSAFELENYRKTLNILRNLDTASCPEIKRAFKEERTEYCETKIKKRTEEIISGLAASTSEDLILKIAAEKKEYKKGEELKVRSVLANKGMATVFGAKAKEGGSGFDLLMMKDGLLIKRFKEDFTKKQESEELQESVFRLGSEEEIVSEFIIPTGEEVIPEGAVELALSYVGGRLAKEYEKDGISRPVISNILTLVIRK